MEPLTSAAIAIATLIFTKASEKSGEKLGEAISTQAGKLLQLIKSKSLPKTSAIETTQPIDYGQAVLELATAETTDPELAQSVQELVAAVQADPKLAQVVSAYAEALRKSQPSTVQNYSNLAEEIKNVFQGNTFNAPITFN
jgi:hypothetical protein